MLLALLGPLMSDRRSSPEREAILAAMNGIFGDHLISSENSSRDRNVPAKGRTQLEISKAALAAAFPQPGHSVLVLAHGLCMNDMQWTREGHDHGAALARDLGYTPIYLHYNTGRHISSNGRDFAGIMEALVREWPHPLDQLTIIGHSKGGLVARSACHYASIAGHTWAV